MASLSERLRAEGMEKGMAKGMQTGERAVLISQQQLEVWADRILDAHTLDEVFLEH